ncbi:MAG TPA: hypothetical protein VF018_03440 [Acidobacteriaceae bacterium]
MSFLASLIVTCTGCIHPRTPIRASYAIEDEAGLPFLVPSVDSLHREGDTQSVVIRLKDGPLRRTTGEHSSIASAPFRLTPSRRGSDEWEYWSLTAGGWARESSDVYEDWKVFLQRLSSSQYSGCFSADEDVFSIKRSLAAVTPLPATEVDAFLYSNDKDGYVDLAPGMEILIRDKPSSERAHGSDLRLRIEGRRSGGVQIKRVSGSRAHGSYPDIVSNYASVRFLRLFLQGISDYDSQHNPLLLGASDVQSLNAATRAVQSSGRTSCGGVGHPVICTAIANGASASLLIPVWMNGHRTEYPLGTQLGLVLARLPAERRPALKSLRVERALANGGFAPITFPRTDEGVVQVVLVAGDRVTWGDANR